MNLQIIIEKYNQTVGGTVGFGIWNKNSGLKYLYNENYPFNAASLNKYFVVAHALKLATEDILNLNDSVTIPQGDIVKGSGIIHLLSKREYSIDDLCMLAIAESDNTASNILIDICSGLEKLNDFILSLGLKNTKQNYKFMKYNGEDISTTSVADQMIFLDWLLANKNAEGKKLIKFMLEQKKRDRSAFYISEPYGFKTADLPAPDNVIHDSGIIFSNKGEIIFILMNEGVKNRKMTTLAMQDLSKKFTY